METRLATLIIFTIIAYLFWADRKNNDEVSSAVWIPFFWMAIAGSRYVGQWLNLGPPQTIGADAYLEGSPIDRNVFILLILSGIFVLIKRSPKWGMIFKDNIWILSFFFFGLLSCLWADYSFVAFKRWFKSLGNLVMVLLILSERRPHEALGVILKRMAFLLLPLSVLFIKFYPELGRDFAYSGAPMYTGVGFQKNALGQLCLITGIYFAWNLLLSRRNDLFSGQKLGITIYIIIIPITLWLFYMARSATSLVCMVLATSIFLAGRMAPIRNRPQSIIILTILSVIIFAILEMTIGIKNSIIVMIGRRPDFTDRVYVWETYLSLVRNPIVGYGFDSFYDSIRGLVDEVHSAHNGYLEIYLNLGAIGVALIIGCFLSGIKKAYHFIAVNYEAALLNFSLIIVVALYSWTEATLSGVNNIFLFLIFAVTTIPEIDQICIAPGTDSML